MAKQQLKQTEVQKKTFTLFAKHLQQIEKRKGYGKPFKDESNYIRHLINEDMKRDEQK